MVQSKQKAAKCQLQTKRVISSPQHLVAPKCGT